MNSCVCKVLAWIKHSLSSNTHSLSLGPLPLPLPLPISAASTSLPFWHRPMLSSLQAFAYAVHSARKALSHFHRPKSYCLHCSAQVPPPPGSLFSKELCALDKNTDNRGTARGRSLPTVASSVFCLGPTQTCRAVFSPARQYIKVPTRW